jgi:hypothetical protein
LEQIVLVLCHSASLSLSHTLFLFYFQNSNCYPLIQKPISWTPNLQGYQYRSTQAIKLFIGTK